MRLAPRWLARLRFAAPGVSARPVLIVYILAMLGLAIPFATKKVSEWDIVFIPTARHLLAGEDIYLQSHGYVYPPLQSLLAMPVLGLPHLAQRLAWFAVNAVALWIALRSAWRLAGGTDLLIGWRERLSAGLGLFVGLTYFLNALMHHQTDILLAALLFRGCELLSRNDLAAATLFGIATAMKCTPLLFVPYLLLRGKFTAATWLIIVAVGASLLPDLIHSPADYSTWLAKWWNLFLAPMAAAEHRPGVWASDILFNQSLIGSVNRWSITNWNFTASGVQFRIIDPLLSPTALKLILLALAAVLGGVSVLAIRRSRSALAWEYSLVLCGMLLFSPMSSAAHFGVLILPAFLLARAALLNRSRTAGWFLGGILIAAYASNKDLLGATLYSLGLWHGSVMAAAIIALMGCWREMRSANLQS